MDLGANKYLIIRVSFVISVMCFLTIGLQSYIEFDHRLSQVLCFVGMAAGGLGLAWTRSSDESTRDEARRN
jgi:hypothetical protein